MTDEDLAYLAGLIDGEGSIFLANGCQPRVTIAMSTEQPLAWVHETFGGRFKKKLVHQNQRLEIRFTWAFYDHEGVRMLLEEVLPYLKLKDNKAREVIRYCEGKQQQSQDVS